MAAEGREAAGSGVQHTGCHHLSTLLDCVVTQLHTPETRVVTYTP